VTISNGIDLDLLDRKAREPGPPRKGDEPVILGLGRLAREKGFDLLIEAHARLREAGVRHRVVILGEGEERPSLERLVQDLGVSESVEMPGHSPNPYPALAAAHAFCLSSRFEGFALVCLEAVALGIPVIATDVAGAREILAEGSYGELVTPGSVDALTDALRLHLTDPSRLREKSQLGKAIRARFSLSASVEEHLALYRHLTSERQ
jgi:glycosyltransferase involved in cell wall biosynthesis